MFSTFPIQFSLQKLAKSDKCRYICRNMTLMPDAEILNRPHERETVAKWLQLKKPLRKGNSRHIYIDIIKRGLETKSVNAFIEHSGLTKKQVSIFIHVSARTLQRNDPGKRLDINSSERLLELTRLYYMGIEVFGDTAKFNQWLQRPNLALGKQPPIDLLDTSIGLDLVMDELIRIDYGVFS